MRQEYLESEVYLGYQMGPYLKQTTKRLKRKVHLLDTLSLKTRL